MRWKGVEREAEREREREIEGGTENAERWNGETRDQRGGDRD